MKLNNTRIATTILVFISLPLIIPAPSDGLSAEESFFAALGGFFGLFIVIYFLQKLARLIVKRLMGDSPNLELVSLNYALSFYLVFRTIVFLVLG